VTLLAPAGPASTLLGAGVGALLDWDSPAFASFFDDGFDAAVAYTRDEAIAARLRAVVPRLAVRDPAPPAGGPHASSWLASALPAVGIPDVAIDVPVLASDPGAAPAVDAIAARLPPRFLAVHPGSGSPRKNWPAERFAALARQERAPWLLVHGPADDAAAAVLAGVPGAVLARDLPLRTLAGVLARAGAYVGNDSGITHLAAAAGAPTVALFGATDPGTWAPIGPRVRVVDCGSAMDAATVEAVRAAVSDQRRG
jgi:ADP-heptose:LPS heptosyltransferase